MARKPGNVGNYVNNGDDKFNLASINAADAIAEITKAQCLFIHNIVDDNYLFISPRKCRLMSKKAYAEVVANNDIVSLNYTTLYKNYGSKTGYKSRDICTACYWGTEFTPYIALIKIFYNQALNVDVYNSNNNSNALTTKGSTYDQYSQVIIKGTDKNILQEFFINKLMTPPNRSTRGWYGGQLDDTFFSVVESDYADVEFGSLISLKSFKFHKKGDLVTYELRNEILPIGCDNNSYYYTAEFGGYMPYACNNIIEASTGGLFNILNEEFEERFPDFAAKLKLNDKLFAKYTALRSALMNRINRDKAFLFTVRYQNKHSLCINEIYDFDLIKKTFDYTDGDDFGDELIKISKVIASNNFIKLKARYGGGAVYLNKDAFTDEGANIDISMSGDSCGVYLNFKSGRHKCSIPVTNDVLDELQGSIPDDQLMMLKCELVLRQ